MPGILIIARGYSPNMEEFISMLFYVVVYGFCEVIGHSDCGIAFFAFLHDICADLNHMSNAPGIVFGHFESPFLFGFNMPLLWMHNGWS